MKLPTIKVSFMEVRALFAEQNGQTLTEDADILPFVIADLNMQTLIFITVD